MKWDRPVTLTQQTPLPGFYRKMCGVFCLKRPTANWQKGKPGNFATLEAV